MLHQPTDPPIVERDSLRCRQLIRCCVCGEQVAVTDERCDRAPSPGVAVAEAFLDHHESYTRAHRDDLDYLDWQNRQHEASWKSATL